MHDGYIIRKPTPIISLEYFKNRYWLKMELLTLCRELGLSALGAKQELVTRIETFISTGIKTSPLSSKMSAVRDSHSPIKLNTPVMNYKKDAATRQFFIEHIEKLTYGDLVNGWIAYEQRKTDSDYQSNIGKQFEYNQFTRDFFTHEEGKSQVDAIKAWQIVKSQPGPKTYEHYHILCQREKS